jgi:hypothetical protein
MKLTAFQSSPVKGKLAVDIPPSTRTATIAKPNPPTIEEPDEEEGGFDLTR